MQWGTAPHNKADVLWHVAFSLCWWFGRIRGRRASSLSKAASLLPAHQLQHCTARRMRCVTCNMP